MRASWLRSLGRRKSWGGFDVSGANWISGVVDFADSFASAMVLEGLEDLVDDLARVFILTIFIVIYCNCEAL